MLFDSNWPGNTQYRLDWDSAEQAWVALVATDHNGEPATERIVDRLAADGKSIAHTESIRLNSTPNAPWTETFRWTWTRRN